MDVVCFTDLVPLDCRRSALFDFKKHSSPRRDDKRGEAEVPGESRLGLIFLSQEILSS